MPRVLRARWMPKIKTWIAMWLDGRRRTVKCQATPPPGISGHSTAGPQTLNVEGAQAQAVQQRVGVLPLSWRLMTDPQTLAAHCEGQQSGGCALSSLGAIGEAHIGQAAGGLQVRIVKQLFGLDDVCKRQPAFSKMTLSSAAVKAAKRRRKSGISSARSDTRALLSK